jgi:mRNA interferase RelE/StbE
MPRYEVSIKKSAVKEIEALPEQNRQRVVEIIESLADNPRPVGSRKLSGTANVYRQWDGDYRVVYEIKDQELIVNVVKVGNRREVYR